MNRSLLIGCQFQGDTFGALWLDEAGDYVLGWMAGISASWGKPPASQARLRYRDRGQAAEAYAKKLAELREMVL